MSQLGTPSQSGGQSYRLCYCNSPFRYRSLDFMHGRCLPESVPCNRSFPYQLSCLSISHSTIFLRSCPEVWQTATQFSQPQLWPRSQYCKSPFPPLFRCLRDTYLPVLVQTTEALYQWALRLLRALSLSCSFDAEGRYGKRANLQGSVF